MTPSEAAEIIGCSARHVRHLVAIGKLRARRVPTHTNRHGILLVISEAAARREAARYATQPQGRGYPRGKPRGAK